MNTKTPSRTAKWLAYGTLAFGSIVAISTTSQPTLAANPCRDIDSVKQSADLSKNTAMGGHVTQHVMGMDPPKGMSQQGKTLFKDKEKFERVWGWYTKQVKNPTECTGNSNPKEQFEPSEFVDALSCDKADDKGKCTDYRSFASRKITMYFVKSGKDWILQTAFPEPI